MRNRGANVSQTDVDAIIQRLIKDADFAQQFEADKTAALAQYDLTEDERTALDDVDVPKLRDSVQRMRDAAPNMAIGSLYI